MLLRILTLKQLNLFGAVLGTSALLTPMLGLPQELHFVVYGFVYCNFSLLYIMKLRETRRAVPGLRGFEQRYGRHNAMRIVYALFIVLSVFWVHSLIQWLR
jgi:hypothetical protein